MSRIALLILSLDKTLSKVSFGILLSITVSGCGFQLSSYDLSSLPAGLSVRVESDALGKEFRDVLETEIRSSGAKLVAQLSLMLSLRLAIYFCSDEMGAGDRRGLLIEQVLSCDLTYRLLSSSGDELISEQSIYVDGLLPILNNNLISSYSIEGK